MTDRGDLQAMITGFRVSAAVNLAAELGQRAEEVATGQYWIHPALTEVVENVLLGALAAPLQGDSAEDSSA